MTAHESDCVFNDSLSCDCGCAVFTDVHGLGDSRAQQANAPISSRSPVHGTDGWVHITAQQYHIVGHVSLTWSQFHLLCIHKAFYFLHIVKVFI